MPYYGVLQIKLKVFGEDCMTVPTFVGPDSEYHSSVPLLIGTNVIRASKNHLQAVYGVEFLHRIKESHPECHSAVMEVENTEDHQMHGMVGPAVFTGRAICIPSGKEVDVKCRIKAGPQKKIYTALIESPSPHQLPQDLLVAKVLTDVKRGYAPVRVMNVSRKNITMEPNTQLATAFLVDKVIESSDIKGDKHQSEMKKSCV